MPPRNLGALPRKKDPRDAVLGKALVPVPIPATMGADMSWFTRNYQGQTSFCGEHAATHLLADLDHYANATNRYSPRFSAIELKNPESPVYDGFGPEDGTTLTAIFKCLQKVGAASYEPLENDISLPTSTYLVPTAISPAETADAATHKIVNYAFEDNPTYDNLCQAIYQKKAVLILIKCDDGFWGSTSPTFTSPDYGHFVVAYDYDPTGIFVVDSADPEDAHALKHIDKQYITPTFFYEAGTAIDALQFAQATQQIVNTTAAVTQEVVTAPITPAQKSSLLDGIAQVLQSILALFSSQKVGSASPTSMPESLKGFLRGLGYAVVFAIFDFVSKNLGTSGLVTPTIAGLVTGVIGAFEHYLNDPSMPAL